VCPAHDACMEALSCDSARLSAIVCLRRCSEFGISMAMPPIDEQGLEEILRARQN
jgi:hypothetical protein